MIFFCQHHVEFKKNLERYIKYMCKIWQDLARTLIEKTVEEPVAYLEVDRTTLEESKVVIKVVKKVIFLYIVRLCARYATINRKDIWLFFQECYRIFMVHALHEWIWWDLLLLIFDLISIVVRWSSFPSREFEVDKISSHHLCFSFRFCFLSTFYNKARVIK